MIGLLNINPDILILAAPIVIVALWGISFLLVLLRKWKSAFVILLLSIVLNVWKEQIPINFIKFFYNPSSTEIITNKPKNAIRVLEYNICAKVEYVKLHDQGFADYINSIDADILFLPENPPGSSVFFDNAMKEHYPYYLQKFEDKNHFASDHTLYSRFPLSKPRFYRIDTERVVQENPQIDPEQIRNFGYQSDIYEAEADINGHPVTLLHVHLRSNSYDSAKASGDGKRQKAYNVLDNLEFAYAYRSSEVKMIKDSLSNCPNPIIISGDFNDLSGSRVLESLQRLREYNVHSDHQERLKNAWWVGGSGLGFTFADQHLRLRLDHVLYSKEFELINVTVPDVPYSDHRPIVADFCFEP